MNLAKALKRKNRLAQKVNDLKTEIQRENRTRSDDSKKIDVGTLIEELRTSIDNLVKLKISIFVASTPMRENILRLGEMKAYITFLRTIDTREGKVSDYGETEVEYVATIDKIYVKTKIEKYEKEIDGIQDELDAFNHRTEIEV